MWQVDARVPVRFGAAGDGGADEAMLVEGVAFTAGAPGHVVGCACCGGRSDAARALGELFTDRAKGRVAPFQRVLVVATELGRDAIRAAVRDDSVASARFRLADG